MNHFELVPFLTGFLVGVVGLLFWKQNPQIVYKYPHPTTVENTVYKDANGVCYKYKSDEVNCDKNESTLKQYPLQDGVTNA